MQRQRMDLQVELQLWDTAGQERFHSLGPIYYRDAAAALIVFDITDMDSFERAKAWVKELQQMVDARKNYSPSLLQIVFFIVLPLIRGSVPGISLTRDNNLLFRGLIWTHTSCCLPFFNAPPDLAAPEAEHTALILSWTPQNQAESCMQVGPDIVITIAANKCDLEKERSVPEAVIAAYAQQVGASYFNTSAKTGSGLDKAFQDIGRRTLQRQHKKLARSSAAGSLGGPPP